jgi:hypothetical protein
LEELPIKRLHPIVLRGGGWVGLVVERVGLPIGRGAARAAVPRKLESGKRGLVYQ